MLRKPLHANEQKATRLLPYRLDRIPLLIFLGYEGNVETIGVGFQLLNKLDPGEVIFELIIRVSTINALLVSIATD